MITNEMMRIVSLSDICSYVNSKIPVEQVQLANYVSTENLLQNKGGLSVANKLPSGKVTAFQAGDVLVSNIRPYFKKIWLADRSGGASNDVLVFRKLNDNVCEKYLYYILADDRFFAFSTASASGSKMPRGDKSQIMNYPVKLPPLEVQKKIADILSSLDEKIELNRRMNETLEQLGQTLFRHYFVDNPEARSWDKKPLDEIANFLNGLAMQKYPKINGQPTLPVIKIREMSSGITDSTDIVSANIPEEYIIRDGDLLFSWSGTLMVRFWSGGDGALNQHLFKVTSDKYPEWLYYYWAKHHLDEFVRIAKSKATTMGHIQRRHLKESKVLIPPNIDELTGVLKPIVGQIKNNNKQIQTLATLRDILLSQLVRGRILKEILLQMR